jgi:nicotinamide mononucleotide adenylyltransferase
MTLKDKPFNIGVIHGRFQILHNDHVKYLMAGKNLCYHLIVGIANPDPTLAKDTETSPHRNMASSNPLTYYERYVMIRDALLEKGLTLSEFSIVPFPINFPELIKFYVPMNAVFFLSIYDEWGRRKKSILESLGLKVHILWDIPLEKKELSGYDIREAIIHDQRWEQHVPPSTEKLIKEWNIVERMKKLKTNH